VIAVLSHKEGAVLPVLAHPGAKRNAVLGERAGALRIAVTAAPERGKANEAIQALLAEALELKPKQLSLISGATSRQKRFLVEGIDSRELLERLAALFG
jgi:uncharacterized protein YggU (UPF0235/DUF167 family)